MVTGQNYAFVQHNWLTFAGLFHFRVARYATGCRSGLVNVGVYQTEFQRCRRTQNLFRTRSVLNTWQFNNDTVSTLTLNHRLRHAKLVYTVTQDINVLLHRIFTRFTQTSIAHYRTQLVAAPLLITVSGWRLLRYAMASSRALASRKVMLRP